MTSVSRRTHLGWSPATPGRQDANKSWERPIFPQTSRHRFRQLRRQNPSIQISPIMRFSSSMRLSLWIVVFSRYVDLGVEHAEGLAQIPKWNLGRVTTCSIKNMTPQETWSGMKPSVDYFKVFVCIAYLHIPDEKRKKLDDKSENCIFLGVSEAVKVYRMYNLVTKKIVISNDVIFAEETMWNWNVESSVKKPLVYDDVSDGEEEEVPATQIQESPEPMAQRHQQSEEERDILTKPLKQPAFEKLRSMLGVCVVQRVDQGKAADEEDYVMVGISGVSLVVVIAGIYEGGDIVKCFKVTHKPIPKRQPHPWALTLSTYVHLFGGVPVMDWAGINARDPATNTGWWEGDNSLREVSSCTVGARKRPTTQLFIKKDAIPLLKKSFLHGWLLCNYQTAEAQSSQSCRLQ
ncbi:hypothetical protein L3X38_037097 [Prunus dulcis]|uniref:Retroviral polymerase SH3-like domain-containing protein n=1 Tax=Prunus dulcis TaxID=3755 RepID=A0AAD4V2P4_PRUDU|nr:hypothetical protein L3X38_037097 [Prunus dulcis]